MSFCIDKHEKVQHFLEKPVEFTQFSQCGCIGTHECNLQFHILFKGTNPFLGGDFLFMD